MLLRYELNEVKVKANSNEYSTPVVTLFSSLSLTRRKERIATKNSLTFARMSWEYRYVGMS